MSQDDQLLAMFFDKDFVPQAYLDIFLMANEDQPKRLHAIATSLLSRLDYYTDNLTKELESTIQTLKKPSEILAYSTDNSDSGITKLEYYLDTLSTSVRSLEGDIENINKQLEELDIRYKHDDIPIEKIQRMQLAKSRLIKVSQSLQQLKTILDISLSEKDKDIQKVSLNDFKIALNTLEHTIISTLQSNTISEPSNEKNSDILEKINKFIELKGVFKGFTKFSPIYSDFCHQIQNERNIYLNTKDIDEVP